MTLTYLRRDPSVRVLPKWLLIAPLSCSVLMGVLGLLAYRIGPGFLRSDFYRTSWLVGVVWLPLALYLVFGRTRTRCNTFDMGLPISAKRLWLTHVLAVFLSASIVGLSSIGIVALHDTIRQRLTAGDFPDLGAAGLIIPVVSVLALVVVVLQAHDLGLQTVRRTWGTTFVAVTVLVGGLGMMLVLGLLPELWGLLPVVAALVLGFYVWRSVPAVFSIVPREPSDAGRVDAHREGRWSAELRKKRGATARWTTPVTVLSLLSRGVAPGALIKVSLLPVLGGPILLFWGLFASGVFFEGSFGEFDLAIISAYMLFAFVGGPMEQLHFLDAMPIARSRLFAAVVLPIVVVLALGYFAGALWMAEREAATPRVQFQTAVAEAMFPPYPFEAPMVRVPIEYAAVAWDGNTPDTIAPWGETQETFSVDVSRLEDARLYTPFATPAGSSIDFVALQISRAIEAVYGESIPLDQIRERYLTLDPDGIVVPGTEAGLTLRDDYPDLDPPARLPTSAVAFAVIAGLFLLMVGVYSRAFRTNIGVRGRKWAFFGVLFGALAVHVAQFLLNILATKPYVSTGILKIHLKHAVDILPGGGPAVWLLCALVLTAIYLVAQRQFERIEAPLPSSRAVE